MFYKLKEKWLSNETLVICAIALSPNTCSLNAHLVALTHSHIISSRRKSMS